MSWVFSHGFSWRAEKDLSLIHYASLCVKKLPSNADIVIYWSDFKIIFVINILLADERLIVLDCKLYTRNNT